MKRFLLSLALIVGIAVSSQAQCFQLNGSNYGTDVTVGITDVDTGYGLLGAINMTASNGETMFAACNVAAIGSSNNFRLTFEDGSTVTMRNISGTKYKLDFGSSYYYVYLRAIDCD